MELQGAERGAITTGQFRVEEFRLPVLEGRIAPADSKPLVRVRSVPTDVQVNYVAGGGAANLPVRVSALVRSKVPGCRLRHVRLQRPRVAMDG